MIENFPSHTLYFGTLFLVGSCYDPKFTFGITSATTGLTYFLKHRNGSAVVSLCEERIISYCRHGTWLPEPKCTGSNTICVLLLNWKVHRN